jgi:predicted DNA-binding transcriptional regulator YafY
MAWVLSFGEEAKVLKPKWLVEEIIESVGHMFKNYFVKEN